MVKVIKKVSVLCISMILFLSILSVMTNFGIISGTSETTHSPTFYGLKDFFNDEKVEEHVSSDDMKAKFWGVPVY